MLILIPYLIPYLIVYLLGLALGTQIPISWELIISTEMLMIFVVLALLFVRLLIE